MLWNLLAARAGFLIASQRVFFQEIFNKNPDSGSPASPAAASDPPAALPPDG